MAKGRWLVGAAAAAAGVTFAAGTAGAQTVPLDLNPTGVTVISADPLEPGPPYSAPRGFTAPGGQTSSYDFAFKLDESYGTTSTGAFSISTTPDYDFSAVDLELFKGSPPSTGTAALISEQPIADTGYFDPRDSKSLYAPLSPGNYFVQATVKVPAGATGPLNLDVSVKSISKAPEPSTWLLMIAGVGGLGLALRRRRDTADLATA